MKRGRYGDSIRIVQIETHFVETDAVNFRAVVQSFTGKDSQAVWEAGNGFLSSSSSSSSLVAAAEKTNGGVKAEAGKKYCYDNEVDRRFHASVVAAVKPGDENEEGMINTKKGEIKYEEEDDYVLSFMKVNNLSFKDFDRLLSEFPLMDELPFL